MNPSIQWLRASTKIAIFTAVLAAYQAATAQPMIATGGLTGYSIDAKGVLYSWGSGASGLNTLSSHPVVIGSGYASVAVGGIYADTHAVAIKTDGGLWTMGGNNYGQLGDGSTDSSDIPQQVGPADVVFVSAAVGDTASYAISSDHRLWAWGDNQYGQLGDKTTFNRPTPVVIGTEFQAVAAGGQHALGLKTDGSVWAWGDNKFGQIGDGANLQRNAPVKIGDGFVAISAGVFFSLALKSDGSLWAWGANTYGELGDGTSVQRTTPTRAGGNMTFSQISAGGYHTTAIANDANRTIYTWGDNGKGQLGELSGSKQGRSIGGPGRFNAVAAGTHVATLSSGRFHTSVLNSDGTLRAFGGNDYGQLADGSLQSRHQNGYSVNAKANDLFDLDPAQAKSVDVNALYTSYNYLVSSSKKSDSLSVTLTDQRTAALGQTAATVYFTALVSPKSPLLKGTTAENKFTASGGMLPGCLVRGGFKQSGPNGGCSPNTSGALQPGNDFAAYSGVAGDPTSDPNSVYCIGITTPSLSAKGQVLMRAVASGNATGVTQCPTVQTAATLQLYTGTASGSTSNRTVVAVIRPQPEDAGQIRNIYAWAVAPDGTQFMQTGENQWQLMSEPMQPAKTITVPADGSPVTLPVIAGANLSSLIGTLAYVGMGSSWTEVKSLNKAGHIWTVE